MKDMRPSLIECCNRGIERTNNGDDTEIVSKWFHCETFSKGLIV